MVTLQVTSLGPNPVVLQFVIDQSSGEDLISVYSATQFAQAFPNKGNLIWETTSVPDGSTFNITSPCYTNGLSISTDEVSEVPLYIFTFAGGITMFLDANSSSISPSGLNLLCMILSQSWTWNSDDAQTLEAAANSVDGCLTFLRQY
jgi:hypothetical protein